MPAWTPSNLPSLVTWFDPTDPSAIVLNGATVSQLNDKSSSGYHISQPTASLQPSLTTANGLTALEFNQSWLERDNAPISGTQLMAFWVGNRKTTGTFANARAISWRSNDASDDYSNIQSVIPLLTLGGGNNPSFYRAGAGVSTSGVIPATGLTLVSSGTDGATRYIGIDGTLTPSTGSQSGTISAEVLRVGDSAQNLQEYWSGTYAEIVIASAYSLDDKQRVEGYLAWKWGIQANLPAGHPYKTAAPQTGASGVTGTLTTTLSAATASGAGSVSIAGSASATLAAATASASSSVAVRGTAAVTLAAATAAGVSNAPVAGSGVATLAAATAAGVAGVQARGTLSVTLSPATVSASGAIGSVPLTGSLNVTLSPATASGTASAAVSASAAATLAAATVSAAGSIAVSGSLSAGLSAATVSASAAIGSVPVIGTLSATLSAATASATGVVPVSAIGAASLAAATVAGSGAIGTVPVSGTLAVTLGAATVAAIGSVPVLATVAPALAAATATGSGAITVRGTAATTLSAATASGTGLVTLNAPVDPSVRRQFWRVRALDRTHTVDAGSHT